MPCKHADLMMVYAKQAAEMDEPWELWESQNNGGSWHKCSHHPSWSSDKYRQITNTIKINGHEVQEPMRHYPEIGIQYWYIETNSGDLCEWSTWQGYDSDKRKFRLGICHLTRDNCMAHAKALFSFTEVK
jgi:hypothetical protein